MRVSAWKPVPTRRAWRGGGGRLRRLEGIESTITSMSLLKLASAKLNLILHVLFMNPRIHLSSLLNYTKCQCTMLKLFIQKPL